jgi:peptide/nickel transport system permease protein
MLRHVLQRLISGILLLFALTLVTFIVYYKISSDPGRVLCRECPEAQVKALDHRLGVDRPVLVQYGKFLWRIVRHGELGQGFTSGR